jgi:ribosomal protein S18 acetylase RimI-like enzyme
MGATVREARADEIQAISRLSRQAYEEMASGLSSADREQQLTLVADAASRAREGVLLVAEDGGEIAGSVSYYAPGTPRNPRFEPDWALVRMLGVDARFRRRGIARILMEECLRRAREDRAKTVGLQTSELTPNAVAIYEGMGFTRRLEFPQYGRRYWVYALDL